MEDRLDGKELASLIRSVFSPRPEDTKLVILVDVPDDTAQDHSKWRKRRRMAHEWVEALNQVRADIPLQAVHLAAYANVHSNNADLPSEAFLISQSPESLTVSGLKNAGEPVSMENLLKTHQLIMAPAEFSPTAPLKLLSKLYGCRAATMPGFSSAMIPALRLDYGEINRRVCLIKDELDLAVAADIRFNTGIIGESRIHFDLRFRPGHASGGRIPEPGTAGNLPSGECYIVPYEGEKDEPSQSRGELPVQFGDEVVVYAIENNRAREVLTHGPASDAERQKITAEPAYSNIAEIGFGVLADFGIKPVDALLLDEKLGLHIAFGRSDHFGGAVGVKDFSSPDRVVHIDRIYIPETQNKIDVVELVLAYEDGSEKTIMERGKYRIF